MSMSPEQSAAFQAAGGFTPTESGTFVVGVAYVLLTLWMLWAFISIYRGWATSNLDRNIAAASVVKLAVLFLTLSFFMLS